MRLPIPLLLLLLLLDAATDTTTVTVTAARYTVSQLEPVESVITCDHYYYFAEGQSTNRHHLYGYYLHSFLQMLLSGSDVG